MFNYADGGRWWRCCDVTVITADGLPWWVWGDGSLQTQPEQPQDDISAAPPHSCARGNALLQTDRQTDGQTDRRTGDQTSHHVGLHWQSWGFREHTVCLLKVTTSDANTPCLFLRLIICSASVFKKALIQPYQDLGSAVVKDTQLSPWEANVSSWQRNDYSKEWKTTRNIFMHCGFHHQTASGKWNNSAGKRPGRPIMCYYVLESLVRPDQSTSSQTSAFIFTSTTTWIWECYKTCNNRHIPIGFARLQPNHSQRGQFN